MRDDQILNTVAAWLKTKGWNVVVIGSPRVQRQAGDFKFNYELVFRFTGGPPNDTDVAAGQGEKAGE